jgi:hypothetical protein
MSSRLLLPGAAMPLPPSPSSVIPESLRGEFPICSDCRQPRLRSDFSKSQLSKPAKSRCCSPCLLLRAHADASDPDKYEARAQEQALVFHAQHVTCGHRGKPVACTCTRCGRTVCSRLCFRDHLHICKPESPLPHARFDIPVEDRLTLDQLREQLETIAGTLVRIQTALGSPVQSPFPLPLFNVSNMVQKIAPLLGIFPFTQEEQVPRAFRWLQEEATNVAFVTRFLFPLHAVQEVLITCNNMHLCEVERDYFDQASTRGCVPTQVPEQLLDWVRPRFKEAQALSHSSLADSRLFHLLISYARYFAIAFTAEHFPYDMRVGVRVQRRCFGSLPVRMDTGNLRLSRIFLAYMWDHSLGRNVANLITVNKGGPTHQYERLPYHPSFLRQGARPYPRAWLFDIEQQQIVAESGLVVSHTHQMSQIESDTFLDDCQRLGTSPRWKRQTIAIYYGNYSGSERFPRYFSAAPRDYIHANPVLLLNFTPQNAADEEEDYEDEFVRMLSEQQPPFSLVHEMRHLLGDDFPDNEGESVLVPVPASFFVPDDAASAATVSDQDVRLFELILMQDLLADSEGSSLLLEKTERDALKECIVETRAKMETMIAEQLRIHAEVVQRATDRSGGGKSNSIPASTVVAPADSTESSADSRLTQRLEQLLAEKRVKYRHVRKMLHALLRKVDWRKIGSGGGSHHVFHLTDGTAPLTVVQPHGGKVDLPTRHVADVFRNLMRCIHQGFAADSSSSSSLHALA